MTIEAEPLPEAFARHRFGGGDVFAVVVLPDQSGFFCVPDGEQMSATRLSRDETVEALIELYGLGAFKGQ